MVGGQVLEIVDTHDKLWVNVWARPYRKIEECAIFVEKTPDAEKIAPGDQLWWQGGRAMWTPRSNRNSSEVGKCGVDYDIVIPRIGFSGVDRPEDGKG